MSPEHRRAAGTRPVSRSDRLMKHALGIGVLVVGLAIAYSLVFTSFPQRVSFQWEFRDGERIPISHITCPSPWSVLVDDAKPEGVVGGDLCVKPARGQVVLGVVIAAVTIALGVWVMTREIRLRPLPELPESVRQLRRKDAP